jgi:hypothetical protein
MKTVTVIADKEIEVFSLDKGVSLIDNIQSMHSRLLADGRFQAIQFGIYYQNILVPYGHFSSLNWAGKTLEIKPAFWILLNTKFKDLCQESS